MAEVTPTKGSIEHLTRIFTVTPKKTDKNPKPEKLYGFQMKVVYKDMAEVLACADNNVIVLAQQVWKSVYEDTGEYYLKPCYARVDDKNVPLHGAVVPTVNAEGRREQTAAERNAATLDKAASVVGTATAAQKRALLIAMGVSPEQAEILMPDVPEEEIEDEGEDTTEEEPQQAVAPPKPRYNGGELAKLPISRLRVMAQKEHLEGYDDMTRDELISALGAVVIA